MSNKFLIFLFLLFQYSTIYSQLITDRPSQTDSPFLIESGYIQVETGISVEKTQSMINSLVRIGILNGVELRINSNYIINDEISFEKKSSFGDFELGSKFKILDNDQIKTNIGFLTYLSIPTAPEVFSNKEYGFSNKLLVTHNLTSDSQIGYNLGYNKFINYDAKYIYSIVYGKSLGQFSVFFEFFGDSSSETSNSTFDSGLTYLVDNNKQLDLSIGKGLNNDLFFVTLGFSIRIY
jgi:hypothetical protein